GSRRSGTTTTDRSKSRSTLQYPASRIAIPESLMIRRTACVIIFLCLLRSAIAAPPAFKPDAAAIQRDGPAYRYPQAGWIVLHIEGTPYERGVQHGKLLVEEIAAYLRCFAATQCSDAPKESWKLTRTLVNAAFLRRFDKEYLEEMQGIADGAAGAGAKFDDR